MLQEWWYHTRLISLTHPSPWKPGSGAVYFRLQLKEATLPELLKAMPSRSVLMSIYCGLGFHGYNMGHDHYGIGEIGQDLVVLHTLFPVNQGRQLFISGFNSKRWLFHQYQSRWQISRCTCAGTATTYALAMCVIVIWLWPIARASWDHNNI